MYIEQELTVIKHLLSIRSTILRGLQTFSFDGKIDNKIKCMNPLLLNNNPIPGTIKTTIFEAYQEIWQSTFGHTHDR